MSLSKDSQIGQIHLHAPVGRTEDRSEILYKLLKNSDLYVMATEMY